MTMEWNDDGWRQYDSNASNCIFHNALLRNNNPYDDDELEDLYDYLGGLCVLPNTVLSEYFNRCERLISKMSELGVNTCLLYTSPSPRDATLSRMPSSA